MLYLRDNEQTRRVTMVHMYSRGDGFISPEAFLQNALSVNMLFPKYIIDTALARCVCRHRDCRCDLSHRDPLVRRLCPAMRRAD
jgi:hypothetical protein